jgi:hypothetical protein
MRSELRMKFSRWAMEITVISAKLSAITRNSSLAGPVSCAPQFQDVLTRTGLA